MSILQPVLLSQSKSEVSQSKSEVGSLYNPVSLLHQSYIKLSGCIEAADFSVVGCSPGRKPVVPQALISSASWVVCKQANAHTLGTVFLETYKLLPIATGG